VGHEHAGSKAPTQIDEVEMDRSAQQQRHARSGCLHGSAGSRRVAGPSCPPQRHYREVAASVLCVVPHCCYHQRRRLPPRAPSPHLSAQCLPRRAPKEVRGHSCHSSDSASRASWCHTASSRTRLAHQAGLRRPPSPDTLARRALDLRHLGRH